MFFSVVAHTLVFAGLAQALVKSPASIDELVSWVYPDGDAPIFETIKSPAKVAVANATGSLLQVSSLGIDPYPLEAGQVEFSYLNEIICEIPEGTTLKIHSYVDGVEYNQGEFEVCPYLQFARLECPLQVGAKQTNSTKLLVPENGYDNRFSFVVEAHTPSNELVLHLAAILDCVTYHSEL